MFNKVLKNSKFFLPFTLFPLLNMQDNSLYCSKDPNEITLNHLDKIDSSLDKYKETISPAELIKYYPKSLKKHKVLSEILPQNLFKRLYPLKTTDGYNLMDIIQPGIDNPKYKVCLVMPNKEAYLKYSSLIHSFISYYYGDEFNKTFENESFPMIKALTMGIEDIITNYFLEIDIMTHRNVDSFPFPSKINALQRELVKDVLEQGIRSSGVDIFKEKGRFSEVINDRRFIYRNKLLKSGGVYRDWPEDREFYFNDSEQIMCLINEEDHLKVHLNSKDSNKIPKLILDYFDFLEKLEKKVDFTFDKTFGYLTTLPYNIGTSTHFSIKIKISENSDNHKKIREKLAESAKEIHYEINQEPNGYCLTLKNKNPFFTFSNILVDIISVKDYFK